MLNQCNFIGNVGKIESKVLEQGVTVTNFSLAVNHKSKKGDETLWLSVSTWDKLAKTCAEYLAKGKRAFVSGRLSTRTYTNKDGQQATIIELIANQVVFLSPKDDSVEPTNNNLEADFF